jgi:hypothetical protein
MTRRPLRGKVFVSLLVVSLCGGLLAAPGVAHDSASIRHNWSRHYKQLAKKIFFTKRQANTRFINVGEQASDADMLDGLDSTAFAQVGQSMATSWFKESADTLPILATAERVVFVAPENVTIAGVTIEPAATLAASDTNHATITVSRRDAAGANGVTVASATTQTAGSGGTGSWTVFGTVSLGTLSNTSLAEGEKLTIEITKTGLGVVVPVMMLQIEYTID